MARYPSNPYSRQKWIYLISALLVVFVVIAIIYNYRHSSKSEVKTDSPVIETNVGDKTAASEQSAPAAEKQSISLAEIASSLPSEPNSKAAELINNAVTALSASPANIIDAREKLNEALQIPMSSQQLMFVKERLSELADTWLFSRKYFPQDQLCSSYKVESGEQLRTIGKKFNVPYEILMEINGISKPEALRAGETIKVINGPFHVRVYRSTFTMDLYLQNTFVRSFPVGLAGATYETPTGLWVVKKDGKLISPTWTDPDTGKIYEAENPDYPLGSRWIALEGVKGDAVGRTGFAIHGTKDKDSIGKASSRGCIRLYNGNVLLLYNLLMPGVSQVEVVE